MKTPKKTPKKIKEYELLNDLNEMAKIPPKLRFYPKNIVFFSCALLAIGLSAYLFVQSYLPLPDIRTVYRRQSEFMTVKPNMLLSLSNVNEIIKQYKELCNNTNVTSENKFVLAWDALASSPFLNVNKNKTVTGLISNDITAQESFLLENSFDHFERFIQSNSDKIINSLFVFALHPTNHDLPTFIIHVHPSNSGKCNNITTEIIQILCVKCKEEGLNIIGITSDGDNCMSKYHQLNILLFDQFNFDITENYLYFSDVLHMLKRGRYHFVKQLHKLNDNHATIDNLRILLNLPNEIFSNKTYTKMHESLAVRLFNFEKILLLYNESQTDEIIYFLPFVSLNEAISNRLINLYDRIFLLNIIRAYCKLLIKDQKLRLEQKYRIKPNLLNDLLSTVYSFNYVLSEMVGNIDLNRCSTSPLEHNFGIARMSCRDNNRIERLLLQFSRMDVRKLKKIEFFNRTMKHRVTNHGTIVNIHENIDTDEIVKKTNDIISKIFLTKNNMYNSDSIQELFQFFNKQEKKMAPKSNFICKSSDVFVNPSSVTKIQARIENDLGKRCRWDASEENLLIKLCNDIGSNCTKLSVYFDERTPNSILSKAKQLYKKKLILFFFIFIFFFFLKRIEFYIKYIFLNLLIKNSHIILIFKNTHFDFIICFIIYYSFIHRYYLRIM